MRLKEIFVAAVCAAVVCSAFFALAILRPQEASEREREVYQRMVAASEAEYENRLAIREEPDMAIKRVSQRVKSLDGNRQAEYGYQGYIYASRRSADGMWDYALPHLTIQKNGGEERTLTEGRRVEGVEDSDFDQCVAVGFSPDSRYLVAGFGTRGEPSTNVSGNGLLAIWRLEDLSLIFSEELEYSEPQHLIFSRDGSRLYVSMADYRATVSVREMPTGKELWKKSLGRFDRYVEKITLSPRGSRLELAGGTENLGEVEDWPWQATLSLATRRFTVRERPKLN